MARLSLADMGFFSPWERNACSSSTVRPSAACRLSSSPSKLSSTSSPSPSAGVQPFAPWLRGVLGVRGWMEILSSDVTCALGLLGIPSAGFTGECFSVFLIFFLLRGGSFEELVVDMPCRSIKGSWLCRVAQTLSWNYRISLCNPTAPTCRSISRFATTPKHLAP